MASIWSKFQISSLLTSNNKCNLFLRQPWHCFQPVLCSKKTIDEKRHDCRKLISTSDPKSYGMDKKTRCLSLRKTTSATKTKDSLPIVTCKAQKSPKQKLTLWQYVFGPDRKKPRGEPCTCRLVHRHRQTNRLNDPRLRNPQYQETAGDVLIYTENKSSGSPKVSKSLEPQPKPPPAYNMPRAVLLNRIMTGDFKKNEHCEAEVVTTALVKPYEEIKPPSEKKIIKHQDITSEKINEKSTSRLVSIRTNAVRDSTVRVLRQAMTQEEPQGLSRIEKLKILMNEKISKS